MAIILGLDVSIRKTGFCVVDTDAPYPSLVERGRLYTKNEDGFLTLRLLKQKGQISDLMDRYSIDFVSMEAPILGGGESEHLFAMNQFVHQIFYSRGTFVISFPPQQLKSLSLVNMDLKNVAGKNHMVMAAQERFNLLGKTVTDDEADAMHAAYLGKIFYQWHIEGKLSDSDLKSMGEILHPNEDMRRVALIDREYVKELGPKLYKAFVGKHTFTRGVKKGVTEYGGLVFRENELFWDYKKVKDRQSKKQETQESGDGRKNCRKHGNKKNS